MMLVKKFLFVGFKINGPIILLLIGVLIFGELNGARLLALGQQEISPSKLDNENYKNKIKKIDELQEKPPEKKLTGGQLTRFPLVEAWRFQVAGKIIGAANIGGKIILATEEGQIYLADSQHGKISQLENFKVNLLYPPVTGLNEVWLIGEDKIYCLEENGRIRSVINLSEKISCLPVADSKKLFLILADKKLEAIKSESGEVSWRYDLPVKAILEPVISDSSIFIALENNKILRLNKGNGEKIGEYQLKEAPGWLCPVGEKYLIQGTKSGKVFCLNLRTRKIRWQVSIGSQQIAWIFTRGKLLYVGTTSGLLEALKVSGGDLIWWESIPGRISFLPLFYQQEIFVPSGGQNLTGFDIKTGKVTFEINLSDEIRTNVMNSGENIVIGTYNYRENRSYLYGMKKESQLVIEASKDSPQPPGTEIVFRARAIGFEHPKYEFYLQSGNGPEKLMRRASPKDSWTWFASKEGNYLIIVRAYDKKLSKKAELRYNISSLIKDKEKERSER